MGHFPIIHLDFSLKKGPGLIHIKLHKSFDIFTLYLGNIMEGDLITQYTSTITKINKVSSSRGKSSAEIEANCNICSSIALVLNGVL